MKGPFATTLFTAGVLSITSTCYASEGPLWLWMLLSPIIFFQQIPFLLPGLLTLVGVLFLRLFLKTRKRLIFIFACTLVGLAFWAGVRESGMRKMGRRERALQQERIEATRARIKAINEGKAVPPLDEKALIAEARKNVKTTGNAEKDRLNQQTAEDLARMKVSIDAIQNNRQPTPVQKNEKQRAEAKSTPTGKPLMPRKQLLPEAAAWEEVKGSFPSGCEGRSNNDLENEAKLRFQGREQLAAAALWLKAAAGEKEISKQAQLWALAARAMGKHVKDTTPTAVNPTPRLKTPLLLANKALSASPDNEDIVYTAALLQYSSIDFKSAAKTLKDADKKMKVGLPTLHLMEEVFGLANDRPAQRDAALRIGYDPEKTAAGWKPYDWDMWRASCVPSDDVKRMNPDGSSKMTGEGILGGIFLFLMLIASTITGWLISHRVTRKRGAGWIHFAAAVCAAGGAIVIVGLFEGFAPKLFRNAILPWYGVIMTLPILVLFAYFIGCLIGGGDLRGHNTDKSLTHAQK